MPRCSPAPRSMPWSSIAARRRHAAFELPVRVDCSADIVPTDRLAAATYADRMGAADVRHHGRAENGGAHARRLDGAVQAEAERRRRWSGAPSTTSAAMAACRFSCAQCSAALRWCCRAPASRSASISIAWPGTASRICPARRRIGAARLMSPAIRKISPRYVRLSGEIADQAVLDSLRRAFPQASIGHAYASTEAGVAFEVSDGLAGFPAAYLERSTRRRGDESRRRLAAHPLAAHRLALCRRSMRRLPAPTALSIPAICWSCAAIVTFSPAAAAASSISAA